MRSLQFSPETGGVMARVVEEVAERTGTSPYELPPLFDTIDPDALERVIESLNEGMVQFEYAGETVTVRSDGQVTVGTPWSVADPSQN